MDFDEPFMDESFEIESALGSAGMGTDEYYQPGIPLHDVNEFKHCNEVDPELFGIFSDCFKDDNGFRPRFHVTLAEVKEYLERRRNNE